MVTTTQEDQLWKEVSEILRHHQKQPKDKTPIDALNRLFGEYFPRSINVPHLNDKTTNLRKERRTLDELKKVIRRDCLTKDPNQTDISVVVVKWDKNEYLVDGRRRTNQWAEEGNVEPHPVIVIQIQ